MRKIFTLFLFLIFSLNSIETFANEAINDANSDVRFELQDVKSIGEELRFYFLITNTNDRDTVLMIRANEHKLFDGKGNEYTSTVVFVGEEKISGSSFVKKTFIKDIPLQACIVFKQNNVAEMDLAKLLQIKVNNAFIRLKDIAVAKPKLEKNTIEIEKDVFLQITEIKVEGDNLRFYFKVTNKTSKDIKLILRANNQRIVDDAGLEYTSSILEFASQKCTGSSMITSNLVSEIPIVGYFEFSNAAKAKQIMLFEMIAFQNNFRLKNL